MRNRNIVDLKKFGKGTSSDPQATFLVLEYLKQGTLADYLGTHNGDGIAFEYWKTKIRLYKFDLLKACETALQIAYAVEYLHHYASDDYTIIHRDLKPDNIAMFSDGTCKLFDFGLACKIEKCTKASKR